MKYHVEFDINFKRNPYKGKYIVIEGIDGSGKTTQVDRLVTLLTSQGKDVVQTREPRKDKTSVIGELIQKILYGKTKVPPVAFQYLFSADREMHHEDLIIPSLQAGKTVISDRCFWSAIPYGIMDREMFIDEKSGGYMLAAQSILSFYHQFIVPDYTFYLDLPLDLAMKRIGSAGGEREIYEDKKKLAKTVTGYNWLLQEFPKEFIVVDATKSVNEVTEKIVEIIE